MIHGGISEPFIRRPSGTSLLMIALMLIGIIAYRVLPVAALPRTDSPIISVTATLPGADPETMASSVAAPLERRFGQIAGVNELTSVSGLGACNVTIQFALDRNIDLAARDVQAAINASRADLPRNLPAPPTWRKSNPADAPILIMAITSDTITLGDVYESAFTILAQRISQVKGVAQVFIYGAQKPAVRVDVDPTALAEMGLGMEDVRALLMSADAHGPKGQVDGSNYAYMISTNDQLYKASEYKPLILRAKNGATVRLSDIATVKDDVVDVRQAAWFNGQRAALVVIFKQPDANVIETVDAVRALQPQLEKWMPAGLKISVLSDRTSSVRTSVADVQFTLILTICLVVAIVFLFLRRLWSTFAAALTVPLSLAGTFAGMYLCGYSIDNLSLMALTVAVGFVVDDAIVMIENVSRRTEAGDPPLQAAILGAKQIGFTVVSISISLVAVFIPLLFMGGLIGRLFREFAVTLTMAIFVSMVVSLTGTPMICAYLARSEHGRKQSLFDRISEGTFDSVLKFYARGLDVVLRFKWITLAVTIATVVLTIYMYVVVPHGFFPQQDTGRVQATIEAPGDISFQAMVQRQSAIMKIFKENPDVVNFSSNVGASGYSPLSNTGRMFVDLKQIPERKKSVDEVMSDLRKAASKVQGINLYLQPVQDVRMGGRSSKSQYQYTLSDVNVNELNEFVPRLVDKLKHLKELNGVTTDQQLGGLQTRLVIDRDAAARLGIQPSDIDSALYDAFGQRQVAIMYGTLDQFRVVLEVDPALLQDPASLDKVFVKAPDGRQIRLRNIARFKEETLPLSVNHQGQFPAVTVSFGLNPGVSLGQAEELIEKTKTELNAPPGIRASFAGTAQAFQESLASEPWLIAASIVAIYIILGVLYESLIHPLTILSTIPSAGIGALLALTYFGYALDIMGLIGIILLIGIVKKNAIMMIDFALEAERDHNMTPEQAIREACLLRFRPIIMTTMAALLGALPLALGHGAGSELRRPMGIAIVGGLLASQTLTLYTTPVVYIMLDRMRNSPLAWRLFRYFLYLLFSALLSGSGYYVAAHWFIK
jgi:hydrophobe/amphiphile efflux-1 (HAE1) family protein